MEPYFQKFLLDFYKNNEVIQIFYNKIVFINKWKWFINFN